MNNVYSKYIHYYKLMQNCSWQCSVCEYCHHFHYSRLNKSSAHKRKDLFLWVYWFITCLFDLFFPSSYSSIKCFFFFRKLALFIFDCFSCKYINFKSCFMLRLKDWAIKITFWLMRIDRGILIITANFVSTWER